MADILVLEPLAYAQTDWAEVFRPLRLETATLHSVEECHDRISEDNTFLVIMDVRVNWKESSDLLERMANRDLPILFTQCSPKNSAHVQSLYRKSSDVAEEGEDTDSIIRRVLHLLLEQDRLLIAGSLRMEVDKRNVYLRGAPLQLTSQEFELLHVMMKSPGQVLTREDLLRSAWGYQSIGITRTVDVHVQRLRRKLGSDRIETVPNTGYRMVIME